jgi:hypothetical protein
MAKTVNTAFEQFNKEYVSLDPERVDVAKRSRDWLLNQLIALPEKISDFPRLFNDMHVHHGSFSRKTKIRPLDDIDLFLTFTGDGTTYDTLILGEKYTLRVPQGTTSFLRNFCNEDMTLNSKMLINKIISSLDKIEQYKTAEKHRNGEAATLQLSSYEWNFDIVPAFYTDTGHYIIPDGQGSWKATDPRIDHKRVEQVSAIHGDKARRLVRKVKYWNRRAMIKTIPSYLLENLVLNYASSQTSLSDYIDINLVNFWNYLITAIYNPVPDPKGFQGDLNTLEYEDKVKISDKARDSVNKGQEAIYFETKESDHSKAINKWREIFGDNFPKYE